MGHKVEFQKSKKTVEWDNRFESILELAEENGIDLEYECRQGFCGTCKVKLLSGTVDMETEDGLEDDDKRAGFILACVAVPQSDIVLEA
ncbi:MAG: 2Fe-2S iron-sulfur cluster binding domain-containing protein [Desulfobulbaceae bacterium]|jgi:2Fe-2S type ferredoxin|nr:2Fe-2S iron-sulfur cluster binding domain-containing protein [Desulfobulbaceae bacterium]